MLFWGKGELERDGSCSDWKRQAYGSLQRRSMWQPCWCCSLARGIGYIGGDWTLDTGPWTLHCIALHVRRVLQFSHATANSTRRQIRNGLAARAQRGVKGWAPRGLKGGVPRGRTKKGAVVCYHCTNTAGSCSPVGNSVGRHAKWGKASTASKPRIECRGI